MSKTIEEMKKDIEKIQKQADLIRALDWLMWLVGELKMKTKDHGWKQDGNTPMYYQHLDISCCSMMNLFTPHEGDLDRGIDVLKQLILKGEEARGKIDGYE